MVVYLPNHDVHARILALETEGDGRVEAIPRAELPADAKEHVGFWVDVHGWSVGVFASPDGPILFRDDDLRTPIDAQLTMAVERGRRRNVFTARRGDEEVLSVSYAPPGGGGAHPYDDEAFNDFFVWLAQGFDESARAFYTRPY